MATALLESLVNAEGSILVPGKLRRPLCQDLSPARIPAKWDHFAEKDSRQINILEQILVAKVFSFGGICSRASLPIRTPR